MKEKSHREFDEQNRETIAKFLYQAQERQDDVSGAVIATVTQFIMNMKLNISRKGHERGWVTPIEIIDSQVEELRRCVVDLEAYKGRLTEGVSKQ